MNGTYDVRYALVSHSMGPLLQMVVPLYTLMQ